MEPGYSYGLIATLVGVAYGAYSGYKKPEINRHDSDDELDKNDTTGMKNEATLELIKSVLRGAWYGGAIFGLTTFFFLYLIDKYTF